MKNSNISRENFWDCSKWLFTTSPCSGHCALLSTYVRTGRRGRRFSNVNIHQRAPELTVMHWDFSSRAGVWNYMLKMAYKYSLSKTGGCCFLFSPDYSHWKNNLSRGILGTQNPFPAINWSTDFMAGGSPSVKWTQWDQILRSKAVY